MPGGRVTPRAMPHGPAAAEASAVSRLEGRDGFASGRGIGALGSAAAFVPGQPPCSRRRSRGRRLRPPPPQQAQAQEDNGRRVRDRLRRRLWPRQHVAKRPTGHGGRLHSNRNDPLLLPWRPDHSEAPSSHCGASRRTSRSAARSTSRFLILFHSTATYLRHGDRGHGGGRHGGRGPPGSLRQEGPRASTCSAGQATRNVMHFDFDEAVGHPKTASGSASAAGAGVEFVEAAGGRIPRPARVQRDRAQPGGLAAGPLNFPEALTASEDGCIRRRPDTRYEPPRRGTRGCDRH
ncbi:MAG: hypothetical protein MZV64_30830 [Ignavibacteriales bacterium]|nr:hypothetical protein [Ignavibacteriales bacterium]